MPSNRIVAVRPVLPDRPIPLAAHPRVLKSINLAFMPFLSLFTLAFSLKIIRRIPIRNIVCRYQVFKEG